MKTNLFTFLGVIALAVAAAGCYSKVSGGHHVGMPFVRDQVAGAYERPMDDVYNAAKEVVARNGKVVSEGIEHGQTNLVKTIQGRVSQRFVYLRMEQVDPKLTQVVVQARTAGGGRDIDLAHELEKEIALKLVK